MNKQFTPRKMAVCAVVAAIYAALTVFLAPISYGMMQCRVSEVLCILPFFLPFTTWGLALGCFLANLFTGNVFDIVFGTLATLLACCCTAYFGRRGATTVNRLLGCLMPVVFNAVIIGAVITGGYEGLNIFENLDVVAVTGLWVGLGEAVVMYALGYPLTVLLPRMRVFTDAMERLA